MSYLGIWFGCLPLSDGWIVCSKSLPDCLCRDLRPPPPKIKKKDRKEKTGRTIRPQDGLGPFFVTIFNTSYPHGDGSIADFFYRRFAALNLSTAGYVAYREKKSRNERNFSSERPGVHYPRAQRKSRRFPSNQSENLKGNRYAAEFGNTATPRVITMLTGRSSSHRISTSRQLVRSRHAIYRWRRK